MLIGIVGLKEHGKSTLSNVLRRYTHDLGGEFVVTKFAGPLKSMLCDLLFGMGLDKRHVEDMLEGPLKEQPSVYLEGKTPRHAMQTLGTEWGRDCISKNLWTEAWRRRAERGMDAGDVVVVDDVRLTNEAQLVKEDMGGHLIGVVRNGHAGAFAVQARTRMCVENGIYRKGEVTLIRSGGDQHPSEAEMPTLIEHCDYVLVSYEMKDAELLGMAVASQLIKR
jgi:hypothetical protein